MFLTVRCIMSGTVTSAGCERAFSKSKLLMNDLRTSLSVDLIEKMTFIEGNLHLVPDVEAMQALSAKEVDSIQAHWKSHIDALDLTD